MHRRENITQQRDRARKMADAHREIQTERKKTKDIERTDKTDEQTHRRTRTRNTVKQIKHSKLSNIEC